MIYLVKIGHKSNNYYLYVMKQIRIETGNRFLLPYIFVSVKGIKTQRYTKIRHSIPTQCHATYVHIYLFIVHP